ncbi:MAG: 16S rRNA (adenine(1518)-N(6)/adenine(1519)-N(6))-dimethyltransferase RsmA [Candidatus Pacebacteria bacterium]|nr:16S rRNA (adenine(1518)-N(6)/adenine(1519)-N(6))-dimethyltransferase RsmA [Candidatus Paceibacterota bacterium]
MPFNKQKKLGQVFLKDKDVVNKIIQQGKISKKDLVLEIGPGKGILTQALVKTGANVITVEKDPKLVQFLQNKFRNQPNLKIIQADIRDFLKNTEHKILNTGYKVVGNIPYYLTSHLIQLTLELDKKPETVVLMVQKEVAQRIINQPPKMNLLAASVQFYAKPEIIYYVPKTAFSPIPKVDSAIIKLTPYSHDKKDKKIKKAYFKTIKAGFKQPRKLLMSNLSTNLKINKETIKEAFKQLDIPLNTRAQDLSIDKWISLSLLLENYSV